jgi:hypothetical protein
MNSRHAAALALLAILSLVACNNRPEPQPHYTLLEVIDVKGSCYEDHVRKPDSYAGQIVRWRNDQVKQVLTYGSVTNTGNLVARVSDEVRHPTVYHTPFMVRFSDIRIDTSQPRWTLHGVSESDSEDENKGYDSTCEMTVVKRGTELHPGSRPSH